MPVLAAKRLCWLVTGGLLAGAPVLAQTPQERAWCEGEDAVSVDQRIDGRADAFPNLAKRTLPAILSFGQKVGILRKLKLPYHCSLTNE